MARTSRTSEELFERRAAARKLASEGLTQWQIGERLGVSQGTVCYDLALDEYYIDCAVCGTRVRVSMRTTKTCSDACRRAYANKRKLGWAKTKKTKKPERESNVQEFLASKRPKWAE